MNTRTLTAGDDTSATLPRVRRSGAVAAVGHRYWTLAALAVCLVWTLVAVAALLRLPDPIPGYEAETIARAIVEGHGFSMPASQSWLFPAGPADEYHPTAWADPVYTYALAAL